MRAHRFFVVHLSFVNYPSSLFFQYFSKSLNLFVHRITGAQLGVAMGASTPPLKKSWREERIKMFEIRNVIQVLS